MALIDFSNEQKLVQSEIRKFAQTEIDPISSEIDRKSAFPVKLIEKLSDLGFLSIIIPEKYGGPALDTTSLCIILEELSKACASIAAILAVNNCMVAFPIMKFAPENKKDGLLSQLVQGKLGAYVVQPEFDVAGKEDRIDVTDEHLIFKGERDFVLNGEAAQIYMLPVTQASGPAIYLTEKQNSMHLRKQRLLGLRAAGIVGIEFNGVQLSEEACLVSGDKVEVAFNELRLYSNIGFAAILLGIAEAAYDASIKYSKERKQFGKSICEFPMVQEMIVDMKTKIEAAKMFVYDAAQKYDRGQTYSLSAQIARLYSGDAAVFAGVTSIQVHGGYGYTKDYPVERYLRDSKSLQVLNEPSYNLKSTIAKELLQ
jgi:alkylation response protein AidB-like acyl-CoA dehydrogenase